MVIAMSMMIMMIPDLYIIFSTRAVCSSIWTNYKLWSFFTVHTVHHDIMRRKKTRLWCVVCTKRITLFHVLLICNEPVGGWRLWICLHWHYNCEVVRDLRIKPSGSHPKLEFGEHDAKPRPRKDPILIIGENNSKKNNDWRLARKPDIMEF